MRRILVGALALALALVLVLGLMGCGGGAAPAPAAPASKPAAAPEQKTDYPTKPINFIVPYEAGGGVDIPVRWIVERASAKLGQPIVVINKPGASGSIGGSEIHDAKPDGYTIGAPTTLATNLLQGFAPYDHREFDMVGLWQLSAPVMAANASRPWKTVKEVVDYAKAHPSELKMATVTKGGAYWINAVMWVQAADIKLDVMPQPGAGAFVVQQLAGGHADLGVMDIPASRAQAEAGNLRYLAYMSSTRALGKYADIPTIKEQGYNYDYYAGTGLRTVVGPKGMPKPVYDKLAKVFSEVCTSEEYKKFMADQGEVAAWVPGEEAMKIHDEQLKTVKPALESAGMLKVK